MGLYFSIHGRCQRLPYQWLARTHLVHRVDVHETARIVLRVGNELVVLRVVNLQVAGHALSNVHSEQDQYPVVPWKHFANKLSVIVVVAHRLSCGDFDHRLLEQLHAGSELVEDRQRHLVHP